MQQPRPRLNHFDRLFWVALRRWYSGWANVLILVKPETVVSWHRAGFHLFWRWKSRRLGRPKVDTEVRLLIRLMKAENLRWGAPHSRRVAPTWLRDLRTDGLSVPSKLYTQ